MQSNFDILFILFYISHNLFFDDGYMSWGYLSLGYISWGYLSLGVFVMGGICLGGFVQGGGCLGDICPRA